MPRCTAVVKRTSQQCAKWARRGYTVCQVHGAGTSARPGGRPVVHGRYSKFLTEEEMEDFAYFKAHFSLDEDLAYAAVKVYRAASQVSPEHLPGLLEVPSKIAVRRKQVLEGVTLKLDVDMAFLRSFVEKVLTYVDNPTHRAELLAYLAEHLGETPA